MMRRPVGFSSGVRGWTSSIRRPSISRFFTVDQTRPMTRPKVMRSIHRHFVDNADDGGVDGSVFAALGHARGAAGDGDDALPIAGADRIHRHHVPRLVLAFPGDRFPDGKLLAFHAG